MTSMKSRNSETNSSKDKYPTLPSEILKQVHQKTLTFSQWFDIMETPFLKQHFTTKEIAHEAWKYCWYRASEDLLNTGDANKG